MRELERESSNDTPSCARPTVAVIGRGRLGSALASALLAADYEVDGPQGRGGDGGTADVVLLCVPDAEIAAAANLIRPGRLVGHCSGAADLAPLLSHARRFSLHPLMTFTGAGASFAGAAAAIAGSDAAALATARELALALEMRPVEVGPEDRPAYHAAASIASNFLVTLEAAAERLASTAGIDRRLLYPLVRQTVENWAQLGSSRALTGPVARGDAATVALQRHAVAERAPELLALFDALVDATGALAGAREPVPA
jgi:predicted short-subunit dehydrogenase-like oxidoreductase (DUF2520 family)